MVDVERVCCMCGDVGFPDQIFQCINCQHRFQHSNYYIELSEPPEICDWCQSEMTRTTKHTAGSSKKFRSKSNAGVSNRSEYAGGDKIKKHDREEGSDQKVKSSSSGAPSPKTSTRRYKLLKDVMC